jgi:hypothetical protein
MTAIRGLLKSKNMVAVATIIIAFNFIMISMSQITLADTINPGVYSIDSKPYGIPYADWTAKWWQRLVSIPNPSNPINDITGKNCGVGQSGPVWFLAGSTPGYIYRIEGPANHTAERSCTIPAGKAILFPVINSQCNFLEYPSKIPFSTIADCAKVNINRTSEMQTTIDGLKLQQLLKYRVYPFPINVTLPSNNILGVKPGNTTMASYGFWLFLQPLDIGKHELQFGGLTTVIYTGDVDFRTNTTYHIVSQ